MANDVTRENQILDLKAMTILFVLCVSWGLQQVAIKVASCGVSPLLQSSIRSVGATILIWIWMTVRRGRANLPDADSPMHLLSLLTNTFLHVKCV